MCREIAAKSIKDFELPAAIATAVYPHPHSLPARGGGFDIRFYSLDSISSTKSIRRNAVLKSPPPCGEGVRVGIN
jgi:hypothetical protein